MAAGNLCRGSMPVSVTLLAGVLLEPQVFDLAGGAARLALPVDAALAAYAGDEMGAAVDATAALGFVAGGRGLAIAGPLMLDPADAPGDMGAKGGVAGHGGQSVTQVYASRPPRHSVLIGASPAPRLSVLHCMKPALVSQGVSSGRGRWRQGPRHGLAFNRKTPPTTL